MVRLEPKDSFFAASCCSVEVVNGAEGFLRRSRRFTSVHPKVLRPFRSVRTRVASASLWISAFFSSIWCSFAVKRCPDFSSCASTVQYSTGLKARIARSRSTIRRSATVCTRPAEIPFFTVFQSTGLAL